MTVALVEHDLSLDDFLFSGRKKDEIHLKQSNLVST